ncbi:MAG TPA: twin-arginine translocase TatA/TatE family subunit [Candidatus Bathyarchaeia archaeon]|nr:twin-arginine translocase TatA/TatE family subunit [Candidatus Bathyarchaeia archaeon]
MILFDWHILSSFLNLGWPELILVLVILIFVFGASRLKDISKALGESVREFRRSSSETPVEEKEKDKAILDAAKKMGIETEGKNVKQVLNEMNKKAVEN